MIFKKTFSIYPNLYLTLSYKDLKILIEALADGVK